ncbi:MAG: hypothetical protein J6S02_06870, partial [Bacteroidaceae bacterium]|nr:hypothetical protein [Bacteroidaceae bacterium]
TLHCNIINCLNICFAQDILPYHKELNGTNNINVTQTNLLLSLQCLFLVLLYKKFMKIFQRSCANRFRFVSECKSRARNYSDKIFSGKILRKIEFYGNFGGIVLRIDSYKLQMLGVKIGKEGREEGESHRDTVAAKRTGSEER